MDKYIVVYKVFKDLEDNNYLYKKGDIYPREGLEPTKKRISELSSKKNKIGEILIKKIEEPKEDEEITKNEKVEEPKEDEEKTEDEKVEEPKDDKETTEDEKTK